MLLAKMMIGKTELLWAASNDLGSSTSSNTTQSGYFYHLIGNCGSGLAESLIDTYMTTILMAGKFCIMC